MKYNLKKSLAGMLVVLSFLPVGVVFAENDSQAGTTPTIKTEGVKRSDDKKGIKDGANFCARISTIQKKIADQVTKTEDNQSKNQKSRSEKVAKKEGDADAKRAQGRSEVDGKRLKNWDKMTNRAKTDIQKAAVATYKTSIIQATDARRSSVDTAIKAYRDGLTQAMTSHSGALDTAMTAFKSTVDSAVVKAKADCEAKIASKTVSDSFNKTVSDARKVLQDARKAAEMSSGLSALKKTRDEAIKLAETTFKTATEKARADLLLALK